MSSSSLLCQKKKNVNELKITLFVQSATKERIPEVNLRGAENCILFAQVYFLEVQNFFLRKLLA